MGGFQSHEQMHVVGDTANGLPDGVHLIQDAAEVGMQSLASVRDNGRAAFFGGEDEVVMQGQVS